MDKAKQKAKDAAGGWEALGRICGVTRQAVFKWKRIPAEHCPTINFSTGIPLHELRADLYPAPAPKGE